MAETLKGNCWQIFTKSQEERDIFFNGHPSKPSSPMDFNSYTCLTIHKEVVEMGTIFTIGYGGRKFANFLSLLKECNINSVVDIRRFPKSSATEYDKESLEAKLPEFGINYIFMGDTLGGLQRGGYRKHMETETFKRGISKLLKLAKGENIALMCKERSDAGCHRRYILETLKSLNIGTEALK